MTDTETPANRLTANGTIQTPLDAAQVEKTIRKARNNETYGRFVVPARRGEGTGTYGLYLEVVNATPGHESHIRYFVVGSNVYAASRAKGASKANWRHRKGGSLEAALSFIDGVLSRPGVTLFGRPMLVELEADSVSQIEEGQIPAARFRGVYRIERDFGKYDFEGEIKTEEWPDDFPTIR